MEEYLIHHGVKGQRWGIRRYQNEDGTRTSLGRQHAGYETVRGPYDESSHKTERESLLKKYGRSAAVLAAGGKDRFQHLKEGLDTDSAKKLVKNVAIVGLTIGSAVMIAKGSKAASKILGKFSDAAFLEFYNNPSVKGKLITNGTKYASKAIAGLGMIESTRRTKDAIARGVGTVYGASSSIGDKVTGRNDKVKLNSAVDRAIDAGDIEKVLEELKKDKII